MANGSEKLTKPDDKLPSRESSPKSNSPIEIRGSFEFCPTGGDAGERGKCYVLGFVYPDSGEEKYQHQIGEVTVTIGTETARVYMLKIPFGKREQSLFAGKNAKIILQKITETMKVLNSGDTTIPISPEASPFDGMELRLYNSDNYGSIEWAINGARTRGELGKSNFSMSLRWPPDHFD